MVPGLNYDYFMTANKTMDRILVAESSPEIAKLMELTLRMEGYEILQAFDGLQALEVASIKRPNLILLEVMMPGLNGFEVAQELKKNTETADIPIIFVTAKHELDALVQGLEVAVDYISKPFAIPELAARVRAAMRMQSLLQGLKASNEELFKLNQEREDAESSDTVFNENSLIRNFNFPEEVRASCEQYLLYFVQFLKDVGLEANAQLEHESGESGKVLFSVTPAGGKDALEKVRQALDIYLQLAQKPSTATDFSASIEVQRLESQILFLQSQWRLGEAIIQAKDATIESKNNLINQLKTGTVFQHAQQDFPLRKDGSSKMELIGGILKLKTIETKFVDIDVAQLFNHLPLLLDASCVMKNHRVRKMVVVKRGEIG
ncbi:Response regulator receiver domain-containing protein [Abditibacterium utsteinense]|uniref:Response regulator receiver domain-containing protein n=2 Tax=Abditibacterium utsteinense TaxID=1960156 RepID=A0A2S8SQ83_9BACT|nr:Response regulator receiver domain-containing protein [Abditibacterium utsteinense]